MSGVDPLSQPLAVLVESTSPDVTYTGGWVPIPPTAFSDLALFEELPFSDTLYKAPIGQSSLTYTFTGTTKFQVRGTVINSKTQPASWDTDCNVSPRGPRVATETFSLDGGQQSDWTFCEIRNLDPATIYTLSFGVDVASGTPVYFDRLVMAATDITNVDSALVNVEHRNSLIQYDSSWQNPFNLAHYPTAGGAKLTLNFTGTSARLYGVWQHSWSNTPSQASYSIDGLPSQPFEIPAIPSAYLNLLNRDLLFETTDLPAGPHSLEVTAPTSMSGRPLAIGNFVIQNAPASTSGNLVPTPQALAVSSPTSDVTSVAGTNDRTGLTDTAKIAIGVCSAVVGLLAFALVGVLVYRRKQKKTRAQEIEATRDIPSMAFNGRKSNVSVSTKAQSFYDEKVNGA